MTCLRFFKFVFLHHITKYYIYSHPLKQFFISQKYDVSSDKALEKNRTSTSNIAWIWTPHLCPLSLRSFSKGSIKIIDFKPGVCFFSTCSSRTLAFSGLSQTTIEISANKINQMIQIIILKYHRIFYLQITSNLK